MQNILNKSKLNPAMSKKNDTPRPSGIYSRHARLFNMGMSIKVSSASTELASGKAASSASLTPISGHLQGWVEMQAVIWGRPLPVPVQLRHQCGGGAPGNPWLD